jgi:hypothetical protein
MALRTVTYDPELWEIVPREPSIAMFRALTPWIQSEDRKIRDGEVPNAMARWALGSFAADYRAMIAAAPKPWDVSNEERK